MLLVPMSFEFYDNDNKQNFDKTESLKHVEKCGRVCYKSEESITENSYLKFYENTVTKKKHESITEHCVFTKILDKNIMSQIHNIMLMDTKFDLLKHFKISIFDDNSKYYVTANNRAWNEFYKNVSVNIRNNIFNIPSFNIEEIKTCFPKIYNKHRFVTIKFTLDLGISMEFLRHRINLALEENIDLNFSYSQESSRYCVAGNMKLFSTNVHNRPTIEELYNIKHYSKNGAWKKIKIRSVDEKTGDIIYQHFKNIHCIGVKKTIKIKTALGYELIVTPDHEIKTEIGYIPAQDCLNLKIAVNGTDELYKNKDWLYDKYITLNKTSVDISKEYGFNVSTIKKWVRKHNLPSKPKSYFNIGRIPWNKDLKENDDERVKKQADALREFHFDNTSVKGTRKSRIRKLSKTTYSKIVDDKCAICGSINTLLVHHKDENRDNNDIDNLITLCFRCHGGVHNKTNLVVFYDDVISIEDNGNEMVYDLEMEYPNNNFIANGICVHNCNYSLDKFKNNVKFIDIDKYKSFFKLKNVTDYKKGLDILYNHLYNVEQIYNDLSSLGFPAEWTRAVLPKISKTELIMSAYCEDWKKFFDLRTENGAHPMARFISIDLLNEFKSRGFYESSES